MKFGTILSCVLSAFGLSGVALIIFPANSFVLILFFLLGLSLLVMGGVDLAESDKNHEDQDNK
jgi:hypothetical protein